MEEMPIAEPVGESADGSRPASPDALPEQDLVSLKKAVVELQYPGLVARISDIVAAPIEKTLKVLPGSVRDSIAGASSYAIDKALDVALYTMDTDFDAQAKPEESSDWWHIGAVALSGSVGGFFGFASLPIEIPLSTLVILRSIADIARSEGEDLSNPKVRMECVSVFAMGGSSDEDDGAEIGYFLAREAMAALISRTASYYEAQAALRVAEHALKAATTKATKEAAQIALKEAAAAASNASATNLVKLVEAIASRYSVVVSESAIAKAGPVIGAALGGTVNTLFISHFQSMARAHFTVRRLERTYTAPVIKALYKQIAEDERRKRSKVSAKSVTQA